MSGFLLLILIVCILYVAFTYFKVPANTNTKPDGFTTHTFGGGAAEGGGEPSEPEDGGEQTEIHEVDAGQDFEADEAVEANKAGEANESISDQVQANAWIESNEVPAEDVASASGGIPVTCTPPNSGVIIDSEVHVDARMSSDTGAVGTPDNTDT